MSWIAKAKYDPEGKTYGNSFTDIHDCQRYIDNELKEEMEMQKENMFRYKYENGNHPGMPDKYDDLEEFDKLYVQIVIILDTLNNPILCWNVEQERFCDSFDF